MAASCRAALLLLPALAFGCAVRPSEADLEHEFVVTYKSARLPPWMPWYSQFAEHGWFDVRDQDGWTRVEVMNRGSGVQVAEIDLDAARADTRFGGRSVHVHAVYTGAAARAMVPVLLERAPAYPWSDDYAPWPGPNSNTFAAWLSREVPGLWTEPYGAALGKDYPDNGWLQAGLTTTRTGVQLDTPYVGAQVGLAEGVELHLLGLTLGVDLWPPQVKLPFLPAIPWQLDG